MKTIRLKWMREIALRSGAAENLIYSVDWSKIPDASGIYIFGRRFGRDFEALYVGKATSLRVRVRQQCERVPLMKHLETAKNGKRVLWTACYVPSRGHNAANCIGVAERALIRYFLLEGHDLLNKQGTHLRRHEIHSTGAMRAAGKRRIVPKIMYLERG